MAYWREEIEESRALNDESRGYTNVVYSRRTVSWIRICLRMLSSRRRARLWWKSQVDRTFKREGEAIVNPTSHMRIDD